MNTCMDKLMKMKFRWMDLFEICFITIFRILLKALAICYLHISYWPINIGGLFM